MDSIKVSVRPIPGGWVMESGFSEPLVFLSGGRAEARAHRLGRLIASAGSLATVVVHDRSDSVVGVTRYDAPPGAIRE